MRTKRMRWQRTASRQLSRYLSGAHPAIRRAVVAWMKEKEAK